MERHSVKTYGVAPVKLYRPRRIAGKQRYCVVLEGRKHLDLNYAKYETALQKAEDFARACYKEFIDFQGNKVTFSFVKC